MRFVPSLAIHSLTRLSITSSRIYPGAAQRSYHTFRTLNHPCSSRSHSKGWPKTLNRRHESTSSTGAAQSGTTTKAPATRLDRDQIPAYELTFTCTVCSTRSSHRVSKQGYHHGTVLISCPGCKNRHLISDNMKIFTDKSTNIEDIMREKGNFVKRGTLSSDGDVEFWDDGTTSGRSAHFHPDAITKGGSDDLKTQLTEAPSSQKKP